MSIYLIDMSTLAVLFEFDAELKEGQRTEVQWTEHPIEEGALVSDFGVTKEDTFRVEGVVTAWPFTGVGRDTQRVIDADSALRALAKQKQPLTLITGWWTPTVVIKVVDSSTGSGDGEALRISLDCKTITIPQPTYTTIPASRLKTTGGVKKRASTPKKGGAATGKPKPASPKTQSWLCKLVGGWC